MAEPHINENGRTQREPEIIPPEARRQQQRLGNSNTKAPPAPPADPNEYGRLELRMPIRLANGNEGRELVFRRPTCGQMMEILDSPRGNVQAERFVEFCCRALDGQGDPQSFPYRSLCSIDGAELGSVIAAMSDEAERIVIPESGDGISAPVIYTLQRSIKMGPAADAEMLHQFEFTMRTVGEISEFLDAMGETKQFRTFMHAFGKPLVQIPIMTDVVIDALDFVDYLVIRRQIFPKFVYSRSRWKKTFSTAH